MTNTISKRRAVRILRRAGYHMESGSKHEIWTNGKHTLVLPTAPSSDLYGFMSQQSRRIEQGNTPPKARRNHNGTN